MASSSLSLECDSTLSLGFVEKTPGWLLASRFFPSKVGGKPAWLDLKNLPTSEETSCQKCGNPLVFLLQVYANLDNDPKCFHRVIFVFMCSDSNCHQTQDSSPFKVFRSQLSRKNEYYPYESPVERPEYYKMIGAKFDYHPKIHKFKLHLFKDNGLLDATFANFSVIDELYYYSQFENDNKVLLYATYLDESSPMAWVRNYGKGRVFYTALGHSPAVSADPNFQNLVLFAVKWCLNNN